MSLHYLNPDDEPRACPCQCHSGGWGRLEQTACRCNGTGRLGVEGKGPDVEIRASTGGRQHHRNGFVWRFRSITANGGNGKFRIDGTTRKPFPTKSAALEAARAAHRAAYNRNAEPRTDELREADCERDRRYLGRE